MIAVKGRSLWNWFLSRSQMFCLNESQLFYQLIQWKKFALTIWKTKKKKKTGDIKANLISIYSQTRGHQASSPFSPRNISFNQSGCFRTFEFSISVTRTSIWNNMLQFNEKTQYHQFINWWYCVFSLNWSMLFQMLVLVTDIENSNVRKQPLWLNDMFLGENGEEAWCPRVCE